jgi:Fe-S-cluster-containing hydrogenase component 2
MRLHIDIKKCTGCRICEVVCSFSKYNKVNVKRARVRVISNDKTGQDKPILCVQCNKPKCVDVCQMGALLQDESTGVITVDEMLCNECGLCMMECPFGAIYRDPISKKPLICDLCNGSTKCVLECPASAISRIAVWDNQ